MDPEPHPATVTPPNDHETLEPTFLPAASQPGFVPRHPALPEDQGSSSVTNTDLELTTPQWGQYRQEITSLEQ